MTGAFLGIYKGSIPVLLGASAGFFVLGVIADVNGPNLLQVCLQPCLLLPHPPQLFCDNALPRR